MRYLLIISILLLTSCEKCATDEKPLDFQEWEIYQRHTTEPSNVDHFFHLYIDGTRTDSVMRFTSNHVYLGTRVPGRLEASCSGYYTVNRNQMKVNWTHPILYAETFQLFDAPEWWIMRSQWREWMIKKP